MTHPYLRQTILSLFLFTCFAAPLHSQWNRINLKTYSWEGVDAWSEDTVFVAGNLEGWMGMVLRTYDGFQSVDTLLVGQQPQEIVFFDLMNGIIRDRLAGVMTTTDGGVSWNPRSPTDLVGNPIPGNTMSFVNPSVGYLGADQGFVYKTIDGGQNWSTMQFSWTLDVTDLQFLTPDLGYVASTNGFPSASVFFRKTTNGGQTWTDLLPPVPPIDYVDKIIEFIHPDTGFVAGVGGKLIRTFDGGTSWDTLHPGSFSLTFYLALQANSNGVLHALNPDPVYSLDWGDTWSPISGQPCYGLLANLAYFNDQQGYFVGDGSSLQYANSNPSMTKKFEEFGDNFGDIHFTDALNGLKVINNSALGIYARTSDGGFTWDYECMDLEFINEFAFGDSQMGIAVGSPYKLARSTNGGVTWNTINLSFNCNQATFPTSNTAYIASLAGDILKTTDAGLTWNSIPNYPGGWTIGDIFFLTQDIGFAVGNNGASQDAGILRTTNGGQTWSIQYTKTVFSPNYFSTIHFPAPQIGYVLDREMQVYKTTDGGTTWTNLPGSLTSEAAYEVFFTSPDSGFAATSNGIRSTTNGGFQWNLDLNVTDGMRHLTFPNPNVGYAAENSKLYKMDNSPPTSALPHHENVAGLTTYPQPVKGILNFSFDKPPTGTVSFELWSLEGQQLKNFNWSTEGSKSGSVSVRDLPAGLYFLKVRHNEKLSVQKIVVAR